MLKKGAGYIKASRSQAIMCKRITLSALDDVSLLVRMCVCTFGHMQSILVPLMLKGLP